MDSPSSDPVEPLTASQDDSCMQGRKWLGVLFECCNTYNRLYRNADGTAYEGCCPRCGALLRIPIGPEGTEARFFRAT